MTTSCQNSAREIVRNRTGRQYKDPTITAAMPSKPSTSHPALSLAVPTATEEALQEGAS